MLLMVVVKKIDFYNLQSERSRKLAQEINQIINEIEKIKNAPRDEKTERYPPKFTCTHVNGDIDYFDKYTDLTEFGRDIQNGLITLNEAKKTRRNMKKEIDDLKGYAAKTDKTKDTKNKVVKNVKLPYDGINKVIKGFEDGDFLIKDFGKQAEEAENDDDREDKQEYNESDEHDESEESEESENDEKGKEVNLDWIKGTKKQLQEFKKRC